MPSQSFAAAVDVTVCIAFSSYSAPACQLILARGCLLAFAIQRARLKRQATNGGFPLASGSVCDNLQRCKAWRHCKHLKARCYVSSAAKCCTLRLMVVVRALRLTEGDHRIFVRNTFLEVQADLWHLPCVHA